MQPRFWALSLLLFAGSWTAGAQFKETGPAPFPPSVARQKIRQVLEKTDLSSSKQASDTLTAWLPWYRDLVDQELIAAWQLEGRARLSQLIDLLADAPVANAVVAYSWTNRATAFQMAFAPMLGHLMERYPKSAEPVLADLLGNAANGETVTPLSPAEAQVICRILLDMPDLGKWKQTALRVLPQYRQIAEALLAQDAQSGDPDKADRAGVWRADLHWNLSSRPNSPASAPTFQRRGVYSGATKGTLESGDGPVAPNGVCVLRDLPPAKIRLEYNNRIWEATLESSSDGVPQRLILRNRSSDTQKKCVVHWTLIP